MSRSAPSRWPEDLHDIWAKSPSEGEVAGESLARHTWTVLTRLSELIRLRPTLPEQVATPHLWHLLFWAGFLHDWGKAARGFQALLRGEIRRWPHRHEVLSVAFVPWVAHDWPQEDALWLAAAILSHHKDADDVLALYPAELDEEDDPLRALFSELDRDVVVRLWHWLADLASEWIADLGLTAAGVTFTPPPPVDAAVSQVMEAGVEVMRHWLDEYDRFVEDLSWSGEMSLRLCGTLLRGYLVQADHTASAHVGPFAPPPARSKAILAATGIPASSLYEHQKRATATAGNALLIAPTGSGKTEAALLWAAHQREVQGHLPRLFYALPYQASMNAMYDRLQRVFPRAVGLVHGRSTLALYRRLMERDYDPDHAAREARWLNSVARLHLPPVRVFSPYQMLKAAFQLKGYEALLADYAQAAFIFDEIHAYEPKRLAMILELVRFLREHLGAVFFVMSATFPSVVQRQLETALGTFQIIRAAPSLFERFTRHRVHLLTGDMLGEEGRQRILTAFGEGKSVLVVCNTVARAQEMHRVLRGTLPHADEDTLILVHGRFNARDRLRKEAKILARTGLGREHAAPVIVVATQVVEVSLNIDLDVLFSDPAPLEALVQRFGRVNRKGRLALAPVYVFSEPDDGQGIYDPRLVRGTLEVLASAAHEKPLHEGLVQGWLDEVYRAEDFWQDWEKVYGETTREFRESFLDPLIPFNSDPSLERAFDQLFDGTEVLPLCLEEEYQRLQKERPLEATELLVPISWGRWHQLRLSQRVWSEPGQWPPVVDVPYSETLGLMVMRSDR